MCFFDSILIDEKSTQVRHTFSMYFWKKKFIVVVFLSRFDKLLTYFIFHWFIILFTVD